MRSSKARNVDPSKTFFLETFKLVVWKADSNTEGYGLEKVNALHNVCKQDQNRRPHGSPKVFTMSDEALRRSGISVWPWLQENKQYPHPCWMWILDCRQPTKRVGGTCLDISVTLCIILSVQQMPVFRISMWRAATVPELATVQTLSLPFPATSDMSEQEMRPPTDAITLLPHLLTITKNWWDWNLSVLSLIIIGCTPKLLVSTAGSRFALQVICAKCERLYFKRVPQVLLDAVSPKSQISRRRAPIWNDSLPTAEECARLFKTSFTLKEVDKKYQALQFTTLFQMDFLDFLLF